VTDKIWWVGWTVPDDVPDEHMSESWPGGMKGWRTGSGEDYSTWVGVVRARNKRGAWKVVLSCYGESAARVGERFDTREMDPEEQSAPSDRFPGRSEFCASLHAVPSANA
jgi:hypothetical protein